MNAETDLRSGWRKQEVQEDLWRKRLRSALKALAFVAALYFFLVSISLMGEGFKSMGAGFAKMLVHSTSNPLVGLFIGILATSLVQSSSATTSMVVGLVASGSINISGAVPIIMGANIGTTVTNTLVSLGHFTRKEEFRRALACSGVHDFFNLCAVVIFLPLELATGILEKSATFTASLFSGGASVEFHSPLKVIVDPAAKKISSFVGGMIPFQVLGALTVLALSLAILFVCLWIMTRVMRSALASRTEGVLDRTIGSSPLLAMTAGIILTAIVQSSSVITSMLVPIAASGILTVEQIYPLTLGANIGTTVTAMLAAAATGHAGLIIALTHLYFNVLGVLVIYPIPAVRNIPIRMAKAYARFASDARGYAFLYVLLMFFVIPGLLIFGAWLLGF